jgi:Clp amino terminal domain, pathogenicity island component
MARTRLAADVREEVLYEAKGEARQAGHGAVEAEDLLLALSKRPEINSLGLDHGELLRALADEETRSLAAIGVVVPQFEPSGKPRATRRSALLGMGLSTSARNALVRALQESSKVGHQELTSRHLLLGVIAAEHGRVPRALKIAGIDIDELRSRI